MQWGQYKVSRMRGQHLHALDGKLWQPKLWMLEIATKMRLETQWLPTCKLILRVCCLCTGPFSLLKLFWPLYLADTVLFVTSVLTSLLPVSFTFCRNVSIPRICSMWALCLSGLCSLYTSRKSMEIQYRKSMSKPRISEYFAHSSGRAAFSASSSSASFKANTTINATVNTARTGLKEAMTAAPAHMITKPV